jgi:Asp-tRNA(Asn)/Glu-tRNA(Gln) amidotransferase A subunit family amidase
MRGVIPIRSVKPRYELQVAALTPRSTRYDCVGPMGKSAWDIAAMLDIIAPSPQGSYLRFLGPTDAASPKMTGAKLRIGVFKYPPDDYPSEVDSSMMITPLDDHSEIEMIPQVNVDVDESVFVLKAWSKAILARDHYECMNRYLQERNGTIRSLQELVDWNEANPVCPMIL